MRFESPLLASAAICQARRPIEEMQKDLYAYLVQYNNKRPHQGRMMNGNPPADMFVKGLPKVKKQAEEPLAEAA